MADAAGEEEAAVAGDDAEATALYATTADGQAPEGPAGDEEGEPLEDALDGGDSGEESPPGAEGAEGDNLPGARSRRAADADSAEAGDEDAEGGESRGGAGGEEADGTVPPGAQRGASPVAGGPDEEEVFSDPEALDVMGEEMEEPEDELVDPLQELQEKYDQLSELYERSKQTNVALQRRVIQRKMQEKSYDASEKPSEGKVTEHRYINTLQNVHGVRLKLRLQQVRAARMSEELKNQLEAKRHKAIECRDSFQEFKRQVARHAEYARTGKKIPEKIIQEVEEFELDKDAEVEEVRGSNIALKNRLAKLEQQLRKKDELAENLHVIDFEQLKIENQTLNERIEERNEELHKLRKKTIVTVQIITHMREKVQFVQQEYQALKTELAQLDQDLAAQRDLVAKTKHERDEHRADCGKLKQHTGIMNSEHLAKDFESRTEHIRQLKEDIGILKKRHAGMLNFIKVHGGTA